MALYVIVDAAGAQRRVSTEPLSAGEGEDLVVFADLTAEPSHTAFVWDADARVYQEIVQPGSPSYQRTRLSKREFRARLGAACRTAINVKLITPPVDATDAQVIATLQDLKDELLSVEFVDLEHTTTVAGVGFLVTLGYLTQAQADTVLAPSTVVEE